MSILMFILKAIYLVWFFICFVPCFFWFIKDFGEDMKQTMSFRFNELSDPNTTESKPKIIVSLIVLISIWLAWALMHLYAFIFFCVGVNYAVKGARSFFRR